MSNFFSEKNLRRIEVTIIAILALSYFSVEYAKNEVQTERINNLNAKVSEITDSLKEINHKVDDLARSRYARIQHSVDTAIKYLS